MNPIKGGEPEYTGRRPRFRPTGKQRKLVRSLSAVGTPIPDICKKVLDHKGKPISLNTLRKNFELELELGRIDATNEVAGALWTAAKNGNVTAQIFWMKTRAGWSEKSQIELTGKDGKDLIPGDPKSVLDALIAQEEADTCGISDS